MTEVVETLVVELDGGVGAYISDMGRAERATLGVAGAADKAWYSNDRAKGSFGASARQAGMAGAAMIGVGAAATAGALSLVKGAASFETSMRQVAVATGEPAAAVKDLSKLAKQLGRDTVFSAQEAGDAMLELAKGGMSAAEIKGGALSATLTLASAGGLELGNAAAYMTSGLSLFNLNAAESGAVAAALAGAANASRASVEDMGMALSQVGPGAATAGLSLQETTAVLAAFAANGILGSDAGTSLKTMLSRLVPSTKEAAAEMRQLGLDFTDAKGNFLPIGQVAEQLKDKLGKLSAEQRTAALTTIFDSDATRAATILAKEGAAGIGEYVKATSDKEQAEKLAAAATEGTAGALEAAKGSIETAKLALGEGLAPAAVVAADAVADLANKIGPMVAYLQEHDGVTQALAGVLAGALVAGLAAVTAGTIAWTVAMLANPIGIVVVALAALGAGLVYAWNHSNTFSEVFLRMAQGAVLAAQLMVRMVLNQFDLLISGAAKLFGWVPGIGDKLKDANRAFDEFAAEVDQTMGGMADRLGQQAALAGRKTAQQLTTNASAGIKSGALSVSEAAATVMAGAGSTREAASRGEQLGTSLAQGIGSGIKAGILSVSEAGAVGIARIHASMRAAAQSRSPSRLTARVGHDLMLGLALGITERQAQAARAAAEAVAAVDLAARAAVDDTALAQAQARALTTPVGAAGAALGASQAELSAAAAAQAKLDAAALGATARSEGLATAARAADQRLKDLTASTGRATTAARQHALDLRRAADAAAQHARGLPAGTRAQQAARDAAMRNAQALAYQAREAERTATATSRASSAQIAQARAAAAAARAALTDARAKAKDAVDAQRQGAEDVARLSAAAASAHASLADAVYADQADRAGGLVEQASAHMDALVAKADELRGAFASGITQGTGVGDLFASGSDSRGVGGALEVLRTKVASAKVFATELTALAGAGLADGLVSQLAALGPAAGMAMAQSINVAGPEAIAELNALTGELAGLATSGLDPVVDAFYGAGASATAELAAGLAAGFPELDEQIAAMTAKLASISTLRASTMARAMVAPSTVPASSGPVQITVVSTLDGRAIAQGTARYDLEQYRRQEAIAPGSVGIPR